MKIEWVNHASYIVEEGDVRMISDPWINGTAFDDGWRHLSKTKFSYNDFENITHIWFSHEHPDHFSPANLRDIPEEYRKNITVLYQETKDKKIVNFCREIGFQKVIELKENHWFSINHKIKLLCNPVIGGDSWLCIKVDDIKILNINDCVINKEIQLKEIKETVGHIDLLLTQYSYANWVGNKENVALRVKSAKEKLNRIKLQVNVIQPTYVIPFASFVWFCHEDNYYLNDRINTIRDAYEYVLNETLGIPIVLYPGEVWNLFENHNSIHSIEKYEEDYRAIKLSSGLELIKSKKIAIEELINASNEFIKNLRKKNNGFLLSFFNPTKIYLTDYESAYMFSIKAGLCPCDYSYDDCDIALKSDALHYFFKFPWGGDTLAVNGRFQIPKKGKYMNFMKYGRVADINNNGGKFDFTYLTDMFKRRILQ